MYTSRYLKQKLEYLNSVQIYLIMVEYSMEIRLAVSCKSHPAIYMKLQVLFSQKSMNGYILCHHLAKYVGAIWKAYPHPVLKLSSSIWGTLGKVRPVLRIKFCLFCINEKIVGVIDSKQAVFRSQNISKYGALSKS